MVKRSRSLGGREFFDADVACDHARRSVALSVGTILAKMPFRVGARYAGRGVCALGGTDSADGDVL